MPEPNSSTSRDIESRLQAIEKALKLNPNQKTYGDDGFNTVPPRSNRANEGARDDFQAPVPGTGGARDGEMFEENPSRGASESFKIPIPEGDSVIPSKKPATTPGIDANATDKSSTALPLDNRQTTRAVSPRERMAISVGFAKSVAATKRPVQADTQPRAISVARH